MSRAEKEDSRWARYRSGITKLGRMLEEYPGAESIANEMVAIFRAHGCCKDHNGVSYDGPMIEIINAALKAAEKHGAIEAIEFIEVK